jgi:hypothetical protein
MRLRSVLAVLFASGVLLHAAEAAYARPPKEHVELPAPPATLVPNALHDTHSPAFSPDDAAREVQKRHGGRVLAVQPDGSGYRVKMLKDGEVRIYQVNP